MTFQEESLLAEGTISPDDLKLVRIADTVEEAVDIIKRGCPRFPEIC